ncbi:MAG: family 10 glycosylhydrolase, partial [Armatimonadia bacterium]|nr:family 10 glycosylhydrolase [Armatimonadia bacterium]
MGFPRVPRMIFNDDTCSLRVIEPPHTIDRVANALEHLCGSQVDCLCWCLSSGDIAYSWASDVVESAFDIASRDDGVEMLRKTNDRNLMLSLHRDGIDYLPHLIDQAHQRGLIFLGSFRMNDAHHKSRPHGMLASSFWLEHQDWRLWEVQDGRTYYNACLDYSYPEVRRLRLDAIREVVGRYDVDGIELDWCRNPYAFQPSEAWEKRKILTDFTREIRAILDERADTSGRELALIARVPVDREKLRRAGIDIEAWVGQGLVDAVAASYLTNNYNLDLGNWIEICREYAVPFYPSIEAGPAHNSAHNHVTPETVDQSVRRTRAAAQNYMAQQPDGLYMFNYPCRLFEHERTPDEFNDLVAALSEVASLETLEGTPKQYTFWHDLPMQLESARPAQFHQTLPFVVRDPAVRQKDTEVTICYRQATERNPHATVD